MSRSRFSKLLDRAGRLRASTLFICQNEPSLLRVSGAVLPLPDDPDWTEAELSEVLRSLVQAGPRRTFEERGRIEFSYTDVRGGIWIGSALRQEAGISLTFQRFAPPPTWAGSGSSASGARGRPRPSSAAWSSWPRSGAPTSWSSSGA